MNKQSKTLTGQPADREDYAISAKGESHLAPLTSSQSLDLSQKYIHGISSSSVKDHEITDMEMYSPGPVVNIVFDEVTELVGNHKEVNNSCQKVPDSSITSEMSSATPTMVTIGDETPTTPQQQPRETAVEGSIQISELMTATDVLMECLDRQISEVTDDQNDRSSDDISCDTLCSDFGYDFNQKYQDSIAADSCGEFLPELMSSSIQPLILSRENQAAEMESPNHKSITVQQHDEPTDSDPQRPASLVASRPHFALMRHTARHHGIPIAPKPDPTNVSCYILVVPAPVYYGRFAPNEHLPLRQEQLASDINTSVASKYDENQCTKSASTPEAKVPASVPQLEAPECTPRMLKSLQNPFTSTMVRVSPSPDDGSVSSPVITVSTTSTPIQPLCGNKQQYVIVQGNNRYLKSSAAAHLDSRVKRPVIAGCDNHQPIYLQGLPPQGFRRLWKPKKNPSNDETADKRPLLPLLPKFSQLTETEATVPQMEKSPLTCIRNKVPSEREVPNGTTSPESTQAADDRSTTQFGRRQTHMEGQIELDPEKRSESAKSTDCDIHNLISSTPNPGGRQKENKEKKKLRERRYDAALKDSFENLRRVVPGLQRSCSRGVILQETVRYIENLLGRIKEAKNCTTSMRPREPAISNTVEEDVEVAFQTHEETTTDPTAEYESNIVESEVTGDELGSSDHATCHYVGVSSLLVKGENSTACCLSEDQDADMTVDDLAIPVHQIENLSSNALQLSQFLSPRSAYDPLSQESFSRFVPVVEMPNFPDGSERLVAPCEAQLSPQRDVLLSAMTTISQESLNDLGVNLSPLLSPQGILLSPGGYPQGSSIAVLWENKEGTDEDHVNVFYSDIEEDTTASTTVPGLCTDMTSIAASVEVTTDKYSKWNCGYGKQRKSPRLQNKTTTDLAKPSTSPVRVRDVHSSSPREGNRRVLQESSNLLNLRSPDPGSAKRPKDHSPNMYKQRYHNTDQNAVYLANQSRTPPGRVSEVVLRRKRNTPSPRGGGVRKKGRHI